LRHLSLILAAFGCLTWFALGVGWFRGVRSIPLLGDVAKPASPRRYPSLSVIVPARDEERSVRESVETMLAADYPGDIEIVAVDDQSTDQTGEILAELERAHPTALRVLRVAELPERWLGKNHAMYLGAMGSGGEWLLFTAADVRFAPLCFACAVEYATCNGLHHLTLSPESCPGACC
jgi:cellulose synthase/poly-beta-1,6-N-acetylglucosamine synthase-like glycosyltransferase